jgi:hypothetical protein
MRRGGNCPRVLPPYILRLPCPPCPALAYQNDLPSHATDSLEETLGIDKEMLDYIASDIAQRTGRSREKFNEKT